MRLMPRPLSRSMDPPGLAAVANAAGWHDASSRIDPDLSLRHVAAVIDGGRNSLPLLGFSRGTEGFHEDFVRIS